MKVHSQMVARILLLGISLATNQQVTGSDSCNPDTQYVSEEYDICCNRCPPGTYALKECTDTEGTVCRPCRTGTYSSSWNYASNCRSCNTCGSLLVLKENCSLTKDFVCECPDGETCTQFNAMRTRCQSCEPTVILLTTTPPPINDQGLAPWLIATLATVALLLVVVLVLVLFYFQKRIMKKCAFIMKKPKTESSGHRSPPCDEELQVRVPVEEECGHLGYPTEETDASQSAVLLPNSFPALSDGAAQ